MLMLILARLGLTALHFQSQLIALVVAIAGSLM